MAHQGRASSLVGHALACPLNKVGAQDDILHRVTPTIFGKNFSFFKKECAPMGNNSLEGFMPRPVHFEIPSDNPDRAILFITPYSAGSFRSGRPHAVLDDHHRARQEPGINGGMLPRRDPAQPCVNTVTVANMDADARPSLKSRAGHCVRPQNARPQGRLAGLLQGPRRPHLRRHADGCRARHA